MNVDVFDEELEEGELVLEQEETEEDVDNDVAFNIIDSKYRDELRTWLEQYLFAQRRYEDEMDKYKDSSQEELDNISQNIEFAFSKIKWILEQILQIFKLYGLAYGNGRYISVGSSSLTSIRNGSGQKNDNGSIEIELVAIVQPITGGSDPAAPPITIF